MCESVAFHLVGGGQPGEALTALMAAAGRARRSGAGAIERRYLEHWLAALKRAPDADAHQPERRRVEQRLRKLETKAPLPRAR